MGMNRSPFDRPLLDSPWVHGIILLAYAGLFLRRLAHPELVEMDDAWMFIRYADHLLNGYGMSWNPGGPQTYGCTSLGYLFLVTVVKKVIGFWVSDAHILIGSSLVFTLGAIGLMFELVVRTLGDRNKYPRTWVYAILALTLTQKSWFFHGTTGMDTGMALFFNSLFLWHTLKLSETRSGGRILDYVLFGYIAFLVRPETGLFIGAITIIWFKWGAGWSWDKVLQLVVIMFLVLVVDTALKFLLFGNPIPLPFYAKQPGFHEGYVAWPFFNPIGHMRNFFLLTLPMFVLAIIRYKRKLPFHQAVLLGIGFPVLGVLVALFRSVQVMGGEMRFYIPLVPFVVWGVALLLKEGEWPSEAIVWRNKVLVTLMWASLVIGLSPSLADWYRGRLEQKVAVEAAPYVPVEADWELRATSEEIAQGLQLLPDSLSIAATEHGYLGALLPEYRIVDLVGLHEPRLHEGVSPLELLKQERPAIIWMPHPDYTRMHFSILESTFFQEEYEYHPGEWLLGVAFRKDLIPLFREKGAFLRFLDSPVTP